MDHHTYLAHLERDGELLRAAAAGDLAAPVPACAGWTARDVVEHTAEVYEHKIRCMVDGAAPDPWPPQWPDDREPLQWFADAHARLLAELRSRNPEDHAATWYPPDQTVGFWGRRMAQETAVHRVDAESAAGAPGPVDPELAVDGIDEILFVMLLGDWTDDPEPPEGTVRVNVRAGGDTFSVTSGPAEVTVLRNPDHAAPEADATVAGDPSDVLLWLWGRAGDGAVEREGDPAATAELRRRLALATQ
jgi:uncharacterized protein (TIGR03083 family)